MKSQLTKLSALLLAVAYLRAEEPATERQSEAYRASVTQDAMKHDAAAIQADLASLREDMRQLMPENVATVDRAFAQLDSLSKKEMEDAIGSLREASKTGDVKAQVQKFADAFKNQQKIGASLKNLAGDLNARQALVATNQKLTQLLKREIAAAKEVARLAQLGANERVLPRPMRHRYDVVCGDQDEVTNDIKLAIQSFADQSTSSTGGKENAIIQVTAIATEQRLAETADTAAKLTRQGPFTEANAAQNSVAKTLSTMIQALSANSRASDRLQALSEQVSKIEEAEKELATSKENKDDRQKQLELSNQTAAARAELEPLNSRAARDLAKAETAMEKAIAADEGHRPDKTTAAQAQQEAANALEAAKKDLQSQLAQASQAQATPQQLAAALDSLQKEVARAALEQARIANSLPASETAGTLQKKVDDLQQRAAPVSPEAAQLMGKASQEMAQADNNVQKAAAQDLAQAAQILAQQKAAVTGQTPEQQALAKAEQQATQAAAATQQAQANLASDKTSADAVNQLQTAKQQLAAAQQMAAAANAPEAAKQALAQAGQELAAAQMDAAGVKLPQAQAAAKAAQQAIAQAKQTMAKAGQDISQKAMPGNEQDQEATGGGAASSQGLIGGAGEGKGAPVQVVIGLSPRDRDAITQLQNEKPPREFVPEVQQYYKNLADGSGL